MKSKTLTALLVVAAVAQGCGASAADPDAIARVPFNAACPQSPVAPSEHLTSNAAMLPAGAAGNVPLEPIGVLRSFLESVPGARRTLVAATSGETSSSLEVFTIPAGTPLYKALGIPASGLKPQEDVLNPYATSTNWYSSLEVADSYANSSWGKENGFKVVKFEARRELTFLNLASVTNLDYLWRALESDIAYVNGKLADVSASSAPDSPAVTLLHVELDALLRDRKILELTTGVKATYQEQLTWLLELGATPTYNSEWPQYLPETEIEKRNIKGTDTFGIEPSGTPDSWKPVTLVTGCEAEPETLVHWGGGAEDLNRLSFTTALDKELTRIIERKLNVDGYFSPPAPSLFHGAGHLVEEVGVFDPGDSTSIVEILDAGTSK